MKLRDLGLTMKGWGWVEKWSGNRKYWFNSTTKDTVWDSDMPVFIQQKEIQTTRPRCCSPTPR